MQELTISCFTKKTQVELNENTIKYKLKKRSHVHLLSVH